MRMDVKFSSRDMGFFAQFGEVHEVAEHVGGELYGGQYNITPKVDEQTMPTKGKVMAEDVTVRAIPCYKVSNTSGGNTVYIAKEM